MLLSGFITSLDLDGNVLKMAIGQGSKNIYRNLVVHNILFICSFRCLKSERNVLGQKKEGGEFWCQLPFKYNITVSSNYIL